MERAKEVTRNTENKERTIKIYQNKKEQREGGKLREQRE